MASKKDIKQVLKELNLTETDMQNFYDELIETNWTVKSLHRSGKNWSDLPIHLIKDIPFQKEKDAKVAEEKRKEEEDARLAKIKAQEERDYYNNNFEEIIVSKIDSNEELSEDELKRLSWEFEVDVEYGENRRWVRGVTTIIELCGRFFSLDWDEGLTENQPNEYWYQPYEVKRHTYEKTITVTEWKKVEKN